MPLYNILFCILSEYICSPFASMMASKDVEADEIIDKLDELCKEYKEG